MGDVESSGISVQEHYYDGNVPEAVVLAEQRAAAMPKMMTTRFFIRWEGWLFR